MRAALPLGLSQFLFMSAASVGIAFNGMIGEQLAPSPVLSTFPFLFLTLSTAVLTLVLPGLFNHWGYRGGFAGGALSGALGGALCAYALVIDSFWLFCTACLFVGVYQASSLYYRFAAAATVSQDQKGSAIAWVLSGGILAALAGPMLGQWGLDMFEVRYLGAYLLTAALAVLALPVIRLTPLPKQHERSGVRPRTSVREALKHPVLLPAVLFCAGGYALMMFIMLASPLAMNHHGHQASDAASVIQWHLLGMFAPSLLTGRLIGRFRPVPVSLVGCLILCLGCVIALTGQSLTQYHWALLLVGVGWNFMYLGGSTYLSQVEDEPIRDRLQALNEFITLAFMTLVAAGTGWFYHQWGWQSLLTASLGVLALVTLVVLAWGRLPAREAPIS